MLFLANRFELSVTILCFFSPSKHVTMPASLQRAMAAEAEASREAKAKVRTLFVASCRVVVVSRQAFQFCLGGKDDDDVCVKHRNYSHDR